MKTGILFDLDGTLLSTLEDLADSVNATLAHFGCPQRTFEEVRQFVGNGVLWLFQQALPEENAPPAAEAVAWFKAYYLLHSQIKTRPYDGILEALAEIRKEFPVAVVSNKPDIAVKPLCAHYFGGDVYALGESSRCPRKPAADMVYAAMEAIGVEKCVYVGDSEVDVLTAKNAGVPCLSVLWGFRDKEVLVEAGANRFCEKPADLLKDLKEMIEYGK